jgi:hypothetical protein
MAKGLDCPVDICEFLMETFLIIQIRANVGNWKGISFQIRSKETPHRNPHVHASYGEFNISIDINTLETKGNLPYKKQKDAKEWVEKNKEELLGKWNNINIKEYLPYMGSSLPPLEKV